MSFLHVENFRLFESLDVAFHSRFNLILGPNTAGKTSLLEAIFALGRGRSFRATPAEVAGRGGAHWLVRGSLREGGEAETGIGVGWSHAGLQLRVAQAEIALQDLVRRFPAQVLEPDSHRLMEDGPAYRRRYLDWGVFHVEHRFFPAWRRYHRALRQRNSALRAGAAAPEVQAWDPELVTAGEEVHLLREGHLRALRGRVGPEIARLLDASDWSLELASGWPQQRGFAESLAGHLEQDRQQGRTLAGPHRAELRLRLSGRTARRQVSRGQQKLLVAALLLAQARLIAGHTGRAPVLLVDDFSAELGPDYQRAFRAALEDYPGQVFVTAIEAGETLRGVPDECMFHVEHGAVTAGPLV